MQTSSQIMNKPESSKIKSSKAPFKNLGQRRTDQTFENSEHIELMLYWKTINPIHKGI